MATIINFNDFFCS